MPLICGPAVDVRSTTAVVTTALVEQGAAAHGQRQVYGDETDGPVTSAGLRFSQFEAR